MTQQRGLCGSCLSVASRLFWHGKLCRVALTPGVFAPAPSQRYVCILPQHLAGMQPELGAGRCLPTLNKAVGFPLGFMCVCCFAAWPFLGQALCTSPVTLILPHCPS